MRLFSNGKKRGWENAVGRATFEKSADAILLLSAKEIVACNDAAVRMLRCDNKSQILSRYPSDLAPEFQPDGRPSAEVAREQIALAVNEGYARFEWLHKRFDGSTFPVQITLIPVNIDGQSLIFKLSARYRGSGGGARGKANVLVGHGGTDRG